MQSDWTRCSYDVVGRRLERRKQKRWEASLLVLSAFVIIFWIFSFNWPLWLLPPLNIENVNYIIKENIGCLSLCMKGKVRNEFRSTVSWCFCKRTPIDGRNMVKAIKNLKKVFNIENLWISAADSTSLRSATIFKHHVYNWN